MHRKLLALGTAKKDASWRHGVEGIDWSWPNCRRSGRAGCLHHTPLVAKGNYTGVG